MAKVSVRFARPAGTLMAVFRLAQAEAAKAMLEHWHKTYVPLHFTVAGGKRYAYQPRKKNYMKLKARRKGHQKPLVFSGDSEKIANSPSNFPIQQMSVNRTRGRFVGLPTYFYQYIKGTIRRRHMYGGLQVQVAGMQPNKAEELARVIPEELQDMARVGERRMGEFMRQYQAPISFVA